MTFTTAPDLPPRKRTARRLWIAVGVIAAALAAIVIAGRFAPIAAPAAGLEPATLGRVVVGIGVRDLTPVDLQRTGGDDLRGAYIGQISPGSPAERVGLRIGDVVLHANGQPIIRAEELRTLIGAQQGGATLRLTFRRAGRVYDVDVTARQESGRIG